MKIDPRFKIEKAASKDDSRPVLMKVHLDAEKQRLEATDSYVLAVVPVELGENDDATSGFIPHAALALARKAKYNPEPITVTADQVAVCVDDATTTFERDNEGQFPNVDQLFDIDPPHHDELKIGIDPWKLVQAAEALGATRTRGVVHLSFTPSREDSRKLDALRPLLVTVPGEPEAKAIVMPVRING